MLLKETGENTYFVIVINAES